MDTQNMKKKMIDEICQEKGIEKTDISYGWIAILKKGEIERKLINYNFYLNSKVSIELAKDKYSTHQILKYHHIPMIEHAVLFNEKLIPNCETINREYECLKNDEKQVIKANDSSQGKDVYICEHASEKIELVKRLFENEMEAVVVCPYKEIEYEYRAIFLEGEIIYIYKKEKPFVIGDGQLTLGKLIERDLKYLLEPMENLDFNYVPKWQEKVVVGWKHNLSNGAIPLIVDENDEYYETVRKIALASGKILDLRFASVDMCVTKEKRIYVMEVNSSVTISKFCELVPNGYEIGKEIYGKVIDKMFEEGEENENKK